MKIVLAFLSSYIQADRHSDMDRHCEGMQTHLKYDGSPRPFMQAVAIRLIVPSRLVLSLLTVGEVFTLCSFRSALTIMAFKNQAVRSQSD
jgi:hypothetical protein